MTTSGGIGGLPPAPAVDFDCCACGGGGGGGGGDAYLANDQTFTGLNEFENTVTVTDASIEWRQTGAAQAVAAIDTNGIYYVGDGVVAPVAAFGYDAFYGGMTFTAQVRFQSLEIHENVVRFTPSSTLVFDQQTNPNHAALLGSQLAPGGPIYELNVSGGQRWGTQGAGYQASLEHAFAGGLRITANDLQLFHTGAPSSGMLVKSFGPAYTAYSALAEGDGNFRFVVRGSGVMEFSDGVGGLDTNLYRSGVGELKTDTAFKVGTDLTVQGNVALGDAITDLIGMYGAAAVAQAAAIAAPAVQTGVYVQADVQSIADAVNDIRAALSAIGITA